MRTSPAFRQFNFIVSIIFSFNSKHIRSGWFWWIEPDLVGSTIIRWIREYCYDVRIIWWFWSIRKTSYGCACIRINVRSATTTAAATATATIKSGRMFCSINFQCFDIRRRTGHGDSKMELLTGNVRNGKSFLQSECCPNRNYTAKLFVSLQSNGLQ